MDFISNMPDSIRNYIVSFLSMEEAVRTSALSKQWRNVCSSLPNFDFSQEEIEKKTDESYNFIDVVDRTICRHDGSSIGRFSLWVEAEDLYKDARIISWITFAIKHKILSRNRGILLNQSLSFCCLKTLNVHVFAEESQIHFVVFLLQIYPNLQTLNICFMDQGEHTDILNVGGYWHQQKLADEDSLESLEKVTIENFVGSNDDFYLLRHLLEKAKILKKIDITCSEKLDEDHIRSLTEKIAQIIAVSPYVTTTICSLKEAFDRVRRYLED